MHALEYVFQATNLEYAVDGNKIVTDHYFFGETSDPVGYIYASAELQDGVVTAALHLISFDDMFSDSHFEGRDFAWTVDDVSLEDVSSLLLTVQYVIDNAMTVGAARQIVSSSIQSPAAYSVESISESLAPDVSE